MDEFHKNLEFRNDKEYVVYFCAGIKNSYFITNNF
jgi:hypothetical protein